MRKTPKGYQVKMLEWKDKQTIRRICVVEREPRPLRFKRIHRGGGIPDPLYHDPACDAALRIVLGGILT